MRERGSRPSIGMTVDAGAATLAAAGLSAARREARTLWAALVGGAPGAVWLERERPAPARLAARFHAAVRQRAAGVPFAYAAGRTSFRGLTLSIDSRALIPRPETEGLVELTLGWMRTEGAGAAGAWGVAADIGTGSGCVALALATEGAFERVIAVERSAAAAALARENVRRLAPHTVEVRVGDLLEPLAGERCRVIVANPPYLTEAEYRTLEPAVKDFEPGTALVSGPDGLAETRALLAGAARVLEPHGLLALEVDARRARGVGALARRYGWTRVAIHHDLFGRPRFVLATRGGQAGKPGEDG